MKKILVCILCLLTFGINSGVYAQRSSNGFTANTIAETYFYLLGQSLSIQMYLDRDPNNQELLTLKKDEASYFGSTRDRMRAYLVNNLGESKFSEDEKSILSILNDSNNKFEFNVETLKSDFQGILDHMKTVPEDYKYVILSFKYQNNLSDLIRDNYYYTFNSKGHSKAKEIDFSIKVPVLFKATEGDSPNVVQNFKSYLGNNVISFNVVAQNVAGIGKPKKNEVLELIRSGEYKKIMSPNSKDVKVNHFAIGDFNGIKYNYSLEEQKMKSIQYMLFLENKVLLFTYAVRGLDNFDEESFDESSFNAYVSSIMNTLVIN